MVLNNKILAKIIVVLLGIKTMLSTSRIYNGDFLENILLVASILFTIIFIIIGKYKIKEILIIALLGVIMTYTAIQCNNYSILMTYIVLVLCRELKISEFIRIDFYLKIILIIMQISYILLIMIINPRAIVFTYDNRFDFFTLHPNIFSMVFIGLVLDWIWLNYKRLNIKNMTFINIASICFYYFTKTDALIVIIILLDIFLGIKLIFNIGDLFVFLMSKYGIIGMVMAVAGVLYGYYREVDWVEDILRYWDVILSRRLSMIAYAFNTYNPTIFGQEFSGTTEYNVQYQVLGFNFDNLYMTLILGFGIIYIIMIMVSFWHLANMKIYRVNLFLMIFLLYGFVESQIILVYYIPTLVLVAGLIYKERKKELFEMA